MKKIAFLIFVLFFLSCSGKELKKELTEFGALPKGENKSYLSTLDKYTKSYKLYDQFETKALVSATIFSDDFIKAYTTEREKYSKPEDFKIFQDKEKFLVDNYFRFFVSFYTPKEDLIDIEKPNSGWNIYLETSDGKKIIPHSIKKADESRDILNHYFPYLDYWSKPYYINFKKTDIDFVKEKSLTLNFISVLGKISLTFSF